jgi:hypothetical protein
MKDIENMIEKLVEKVINEEVNSKVKNITESVSQEIDEMEEYYEVAKKRKEERMANKEEPKEGMGKMPELRDKFDGRDSRVVGVDSDIDKQRMEEEELEEGNEFTVARCKAGLNGDKKFKVGDKEYDLEDWSDEDEKSCKGVNESKKQTLQLTEDEMIELIERIVKEQKIEGISSEKKAMKSSKKDNDDYIKSVTKKMKDYLKDGSAGDYDMEPKTFPKGNGELGDNEKMAYKASKGVEEYIKQIARSGGQENLDYDQIKPDEEWLDMNLVGSSETGNNPEWANAVKTDVGDEVKDRKDKNVLAKLKKQSYNKAPQPITDYSGNKTHDDEMAGINVAESKNEKKVNENIDRMKKLFSHNYKTQ